MKVIFCWDSCCWTLSWLSWLEARVTWSLSWIWLTCPWWPGHCCWHSWCHCIRRLECCEQQWLLLCSELGKLFQLALFRSIGSLDDEPGRLLITFETFIYVVHKNEKSIKLSRFLNIFKNLSRKHALKTFSKNMINFSITPLTSHNHQHLYPLTSHGEYLAAAKSRWDYLLKDILRKLLTSLDSWHWQWGRAGVSRTLDWGHELSLSTDKVWHYVVSWYLIDDRKVWSCCVVALKVFLMKVRETGGSSGHTRPGLTLIVSCTVTCSARVKDYYPHINIQTTTQHWYDWLFIWTTAAVTSCCSGSCCWCCCCQLLRPALTALLHWIITAPASPVSCTIYYSATLSWILQNCWSSLVMTGDMSCFFNDWLSRRNLLLLLYCWVNIVPLVSCNTTVL